MTNPLIEKYNELYGSKQKKVERFNYVDLDLPQLERETIDGVRYYKVPNEDELIKLVSITSVTSHKNRQFFADWRKKVGEEKANKITKQATSRGTDMHTLAENYLKNEEFEALKNQYEIMKASLSELASKLEKRLLCEPRKTKSDT